MVEKIIKFKVNEIIYLDEYFEYTAYVKNNGITTVTWSKDGKEESLDYLTTDVEEYLKEGDWVEIQKNKNEIDFDKVKEIRLRQNR